MDRILYFLTGIGLLVVLTVIYFLFIGTLKAIVDTVKKKKRKYQIKHRFDSPPTAKCYCKDCIWYDEDRIFKSEREGHCRWFDLTVEDDSFCWKADPKGL